MRCASYCVAESINFGKLVDILLENGLEPQFFDEVVHAKKRSDNNSQMDIFYFPFGSVVIWNGTEYEEKNILDQISDVCVKLIDEPYPDFIYYKIVDGIERTYIDEEENLIVLHDDSSFVKLSMSHALAQSIKLHVLEDSVSSMLDKTNVIRKELAEKGAVSMSKKDLSKKIGELFNERYYVNLHSDILDTPEFFWRRPSYEPIYLTTTEFMDIQTRQNILNHRLNMIQELYSLLSEELNYKHSTRLELVIIILITIEVIIAVFQNNIIGKIWKFFFS